MSPSSAALRSSPAIAPGFLASMSSGGRQNLFACKAGRRGGNLPLLLVQVFRGKDSRRVRDSSRKLPPAAATIGELQRIPNCEGEATVAIVV